MIAKIYIENFKGFGKPFELDLQEDLNIVVGDNETGKSSILEAIGLALTRRINGRLLDNELTAYLFNKDVVASYVRSVREGGNPPLPRILIEAWFSDDESVRALRGTHNHSKTDAFGVRLEVAFNDDYAPEYAAFIHKRLEVTTIPIEYYSVQWCSFAGSAISARGMPVGLSYIDATTIRLQSGTDYYLQSIINTGLDPKERVALALAYRSLKEKFSGEAAIKAINQKLTQNKGAITDKDLAITVDVSQKTSWEANLTPHLDDLPFHLIGKGEQSALKIMLALDRQLDEAQVVLIEEPENHLSFSSMQKLIAKIKEKCAAKQIIVTTHSAYVLNKLGIEKTVLLHDGATTTLAKLPFGTQEYFKKLSGYDTLRIILAKRSILVEGPSDELIIQKAYIKRHGHPPADDGVDVINVRGLSFPRFLDIAKELGKSVCVVTDNDENYERKVVERYQPYDGIATIKICADSDNAAHTLELQVTKCNDLATLNNALGTSHPDKVALAQYMMDNKTEWALRVYESAVEIAFPAYIEAAL